MLTWTQWPLWGEVPCSKAGLKCRYSGSGRGYLHRWLQVISDQFWRVVSVSVSNLPSARMRSEGVGICPVCVSVCVCARLSA